jgi:sporulation protein YlmC with PRC-barrel domain
MRANSLITVVACALTLAWSSMAAAQATESRSDAPEGQTQSSEHAGTMHAGEQKGLHVGKGVSKIFRAKELMGMNVWNAQNEKLGDISDLVFDTSNGKLLYAILGHGGTLGIGEKYCVVPVDFLSLERDNKTNKDYLVLNIDKQRLKDAPSFSGDNWPNFGDQRFVTEIREFFTSARTASRPETPPAR